MTKEPLHNPYSCCNQTFNYRDEDTMSAKSAQSAEDSSPIYCSIEAQREPDYIVLNIRGRQQREDYKHPLGLRVIDAALGYDMPRRE